MPNIIKHRGINIVTLDSGESILEYCKDGDIAISEKPDGWWTSFIGENGEITDYDAPFESYNKALWTAKAAAEFQAE